MRLLFSRLRRGVARFIYPEMGCDALHQMDVQVRDPGTGKATRPSICTSMPADGRTVSQAVPVAVSGASAQQDPMTEPKAWECLSSQAQAEAWLAAASEAELHELAEQILAGRPLSHEEAARQQPILLALCASEALWRRVIEAGDAGKHPKFRWRPQAAVQGHQT